jgi:hypothetical protein
MALSTKLFVSGAVASVALAYYVRSKHERTGESYVSIVRGLPGDARRWVESTRARAVRALEAGKTAARERDEEFTRQLEAAGAPPGA